MRFDDDPLDVLITGRAKLWMLLVGVNHYQDGRLTPLNFAVSDCQGLADALEAATQRFRNKEVIIHSTAAALTVTLEAIRSSLQRIANAAKPQDTVLFYFSGHGLVDPATQQPFLCLPETQTDSLPNTGLGLRELLQQLQQCGANKQLVMLDACHSSSLAVLWGGARGAAETQSSPTREIATVLQECAAQSRGFCALLSCDEKQRSWEFPDLEHGVFTYHLIQGLQGEATDVKGIIEAKGLYDYVYDQTQRYVDDRMRQLRLPAPGNYQQTPRLIMSMAGNLVLGFRPEADDFLKDYEDRLREYRKKFNIAIQQEYPLSQDTRQQLQRLQQSLGLREEDISSVEKQIMAIHEPKLQRYEQEFNALIQQQYPLDHNTRQPLQLLQQSLGLGEQVTNSIEAQVTQGHEQKLQQYGEAFTRAIQRQYPLRDSDHEFLTNLRQALNLSQETTQSIEAQVAQEYQQKLQPYEAAFTKDHQEYPPLVPIKADETPGSAAHINTPPASPVANQAQPRSKRKSPFRRSAWLLIGGGSALALATGMYYSHWLPNPPSVQEEVAEFSSIKTLSGHSGSVWSVAVSSNGQTLVSGSEDKTIKVWNLATGQLSRTLSGHSDTVRAIALSSDGRILASGSGDTTIKLWNMQTGELLRTLEGHSGPVWSIALSPDGQTLVSGSEDSTIKIWNLQTGDLQRILFGHSGRVFSVALSPDGQTIATGGTDKTIKLWNLQTGELRHTLEGHADAVRSIVFSPGGQQLASSSWDRTIKIWQPQTGQQLRTLEGQTTRMASIAYAPSAGSANSADKPMLAGAGLDKTVKVWNLQTGKLLSDLSGHSDWVLSVATSPTGQTLISGSKDKTIKIWRQ
jgi:WD40 repeat protein